MSYDEIRNIAIIAHVDHGKSTLTTQMLKQASTLLRASGVSGDGIFHEGQTVSEQEMDSNKLEQERGITILAKCTSFLYYNDDDGKMYKFNIIDTPGHADFGGEVERILSMADGVLLLVDAYEGPMPQTKFVLQKAFMSNLTPIVMINKVDKEEARPEEVHDEILELFMDLAASDNQLEFKTLYGSGRSGWCTQDLSIKNKDLKPIFNAIINHVPSPKCDGDAPFKMLGTLLDYDKYLGRILIGKVESGEITVGQNVSVVNLSEVIIESGRLTKLFSFVGLTRVPIEHAKAGEIIAVAGLEKASVSDTVASAASDLKPIASTPIDPPTMFITIRVNDSPLAGQDGSKLTSREIHERLMQEKEINVAITLETDETGEAFKVGGRGELQLGILIENMRREGYELSVSKPQVITKTIDGKKTEPMEDILIDVDDDFSGAVIEKLSNRKCEMQDMQPCGTGKTRITMIGPSRALIGYNGEFLTDTRGTGVINHIFREYGPHLGKLSNRNNGVLIANGLGPAVGYALFNLQDRGKLFIKPQVQVYQGMMIGEHSKSNDLDVNPLKGKQLTNMRASGSDEHIKLSPPIEKSLEEMMAYVEEDELLEVTPNYLRMRKKYLDPNDRKRAARKNG